MLHAKKELGQNFLNNKVFARTLAEAANIKKEDTIIEVGAGTGSVTKEIAKKAGRVFAIEFDRDLIPVLESNLQSFNNVTIVNKDILKIDFSALGFGPPAGGLDLEIPTIVGSVPFQITSPLIHKLIFENRWTETALLVQDEVAKKITAQTPQATYLSNFVRAFTKPTYIKKVPKEAFQPIPKVDGAIIHLEWLPTAKVPNPQKWKELLHKGFQHPRKMLRNVFPEEQLRKLGINPKARPQELTTKNWIDLYSSNQ